MIQFVFSQCLLLFFVQYDVMVVVNVHVDYSCIWMDSVLIYVVFVKLIVCVFWA